MAYISPNLFLHEAKELAIGSSTYMEHRGCTPNPKMWVLHSKEGYVAFCNKCGQKGYKSKGIVPLKDLEFRKEQTENEYSASVELPFDFDDDIDNFSVEARLWLYKSDIRDYQIHKYGIGYSKSLGRVIIPVYNENMELLMWQGRGLYPEQTKYYNLRGANKNELFFKSWVSKEKIHTYTKDKVVVVEDCLSVIKVGRTCPTVAGLGTSLSQKQYNFLASFDKVVFWYDEDKGGLFGSEKSLRRLSLVTDCYRVRTKEDPKNLTYNEIEDELKEGRC